jgi:hypothetical protein
MLKEIQKEYLLIALGLSIFIAICFYLVQSNIFLLSGNYQYILTKLVPMSIVIGLSASFYFGNKHLKIAKSAKKSDAKINSFTKALRIKNACLLIPGIIAGLSAVVSGETQFLFIALAILIVILIAFPTKVKSISAMEISDKNF